jgi:hypothetical protein
MSNIADSSSSGFMTRVFQNDAAKKGIAGALAGIIVAAVAEALFATKT